MRTIVILNIKGGVGKTTTAVNVAHVLARDYDKKVLLIDNDKQGNLSRTCNAWGYDKAGVAELLTGEKGIREVIQDKDNFGVISANMTLLNANLEVITDQERDQATIFKDAFKEIEGEYDYCIIDNPPDINISVINGLVAADEVIIPIKIDGYALDGMTELERQIENAKRLNPKLKFRGCLVTMYYNREVCKQGEAYLRSQRYPVFNTHIRRTEKVDEMTFSEVNLMEYSPRSGAAKDYKAFVKEYLEV